MMRLARASAGVGPGDASTIWVTGRVSDLCGRAAQGRGSPDGVERAEWDGQIRSHDPARPPANRPSRQTEARGIPMTNAALRDETPDWAELDALKDEDEDRALAGLLADPPLDESARAGVTAEARALVVKA